MNLKDYWATKFAGTKYGITRAACHAIGMEWPPYKGWVKERGGIEMTPELIEVFERHIPKSIQFGDSNHVPEDRKS